MAQIFLANFLDWTNKHLLVVPTGSPNIPQAAFKVLSKYEEMRKLLYEHYQDVSHLASSFGIMNKAIMIRLLSYKFKEKVAKWFRT